MAGASIIESTKTGLLGIPVTASVTYSTLCQIKAGQASCEARTNIRWYKSDGTASAVTPLSSGTFTALSTSAWTAVLQNAVTSPSDAAFAAVEIEWRHTVTSVVGHFINVDTVVFARTNQAAWGPGSGSTNIKWVVERSEDLGASWYPIWGGSYNSPITSKSPSDIRVRIRDRAAQLGEFGQQVFYRVYAIGYDTNGLPVYSLPTLVDPNNSQYIVTDSGFIRDPYDPQWDQPLHIIAYPRKFSVQGEMYAAQGSVAGKVVYDTSPVTEVIDFQVWQDTMDLNLKLQTILLSKRMLHVQTGLGPKWYLQPFGDITIEQVKASPPLGLFTDKAVRWFQRYSFSAVAIQPPDFVNYASTF